VIETISFIGMDKNSVNKNRWREMLRRLEEEFDSREVELSVLQELDRKIVDASLNQIEIYDFIVKSIKDLCGAEAAQILIRNKDSLKVVASIPECAVNRLLSVGDCATGICVETKKGFISNDITVDDKVARRYVDFLGKVLGEPIKSELAVPMMLNNEVVGVLNAESPRENAFDEHNKNVLSSFASQCAIAFSKIKIIDEIQLFHDIMDAISDYDQDIRVPVIIQGALKKLEEYIGSIYHYQLLFVDHGEMVIAFSSIVQDVGARVDINNSVSGRVVRSGKTQIVEDVTKDPEFRRVLDEAVAAEMAVPITIAGNVVGVINFESDKIRYFDGFSRVIVEQFSRQIQWIITLLRFKYNEDIKRRHEKALEVMQAMGSQTSSLVHDLNNKLVPAKLRCEQLKKSMLSLYEVDPSFRERIDDVCDGINEALVIPSQMKKILGEVVELDIKKTLHEIVRQTKITFTKVKIDLNLCGDVGIIKSGSFRGVVSNVIRNACEAVGGEGVVGVKVEKIKFTDLAQEFVDVTIKDDGKGIPNGDFEKIFEWSYTTKKEKEEKGLGFGLAWCKAMVENEKGRISATNSPEGGAVFKVRYLVNNKREE